MAAFIGATYHRGFLCLPLVLRAHLVECLVDEGALDKGPEADREAGVHDVKQRLSEALLPRTIGGVAGDGGGGG